ncbi:hypothetical protein J437_LFUL007532 [Ladona fulva]|uniref:Hexosyltransferase n=1 Tax=Ladona fulva TaxID=123851 RepID=A0A8K0K589_LADFU|nr:hypothetical protein J437_LFUL007532 [Ladona fulva]
MTDRLPYVEMIQLLILVTSAPPNTEARSAIRRTWANESQLPLEAEVFFVLGTTYDEKVMETVEKEAEKYNDIIMEDFIDSYDNLTYKTLFALKWATRNCFKATHLLKTDDDMLIIPENILRRLIYVRDFLSLQGKINNGIKEFIPSIRKKQHWRGKNNSLSKENPIQDLAHKKNETVNKFDTGDDYLCITEQETKRDEDKIGAITNGYILGKILRRVPPYRDRKSKWFIPYTLYNEDYLPDFATGTAYVIANGNKNCGVIKSLFINSLKITPVLPLEDVFVTGIVAEHLDLLLIEDNTRFSSSIPVLFPWTLSRLATCYYYDMAAIHGLKPNDLITAWKKLQDITAYECQSTSGLIQKKIYAMLAMFEMPNG